MAVFKGKPVDSLRGWSRGAVSVGEAQARCPGVCRHSWAQVFGSRG